MKKEEFIKLGIDEETAKKCEQASQEELKGFIPKARFDEVNDEKKKLQDDVKERDGQLETLRKSAGDNEALQKQIEDLQKENKEKDEAHAKEIQQMKLDTAIDTAISGANGKNAKAIKALLNLEGAELAEDGTVKGLSDQLAALQKSDSYLFDSKQKNIKGAKPGEGGKEDPDGKVDFSKMTYSETLAYLAENPDAKID